jgi:hypothetical protein
MRNEPKRSETKRVTTDTTHDKEEAKRNEAKQKNHQ